MTGSGLFHGFLVLIFPEETTQHKSHFPNPGSSARVHINVSEIQRDTPLAPLSLHCPRSCSAPRRFVFYLFSTPFPPPPLAFPNPAQAGESNAELHLRALLRAELPYMISQVGCHLPGITSPSEAFQKLPCLPNLASLFLESQTFPCFSCIFPAPNIAVAFNNCCFTHTHTEDVRRRLLAIS